MANNREQPQRMVRLARLVFDGVRPPRSQEQAWRECGEELRLAGVKIDRYPRPGAKR